MQCFFFLPFLLSSFFPLSLSFVLSSFLSFHAFIYSFIEKHLLNAAYIDSIFPQLCSVQQGDRKEYLLSGSSVQLKKLGTVSNNYVVIIMSTMC